MPDSGKREHVKCTKLPPLPLAPWVLNLSEVLRLGHTPTMMLATTCVTPAA